MGHWIGPVLTAALLAVVAGLLVMPPTVLGENPWLGVVPLAVGIAHGLAVAWLGGRIDSAAHPDLIRWVALSYAFVIGVVVIGLAIPIFRSVLVMALAFIAGAVAPLIDERLVIRSATRRP